MENPIITTIILTHRRPKLLKRALSSALEQTYPHIQICVYDNASRDETAHVVNEFIKRDPRVKYHCHPENIGMMGNYQYSLTQVTTPYFSILSDDDVLLPWFYEEAMKGFQQYPDIAFSAASTIIMSEEGRVVRVPIDHWKREGHFAVPQGVLEMISKYPPPISVLFHQKVIKNVPIDMSNALTWDCDFLIQISSQYPFYISKKPCALFLHHHSSYSNSKQLEDWQYSLNKMKERINQNEHLRDEDKKHAINLMDYDLKLKNRAFILLSLFSRKFAVAREYADSFTKNYGLNLEMRVFIALIAICRLFPPALQLLLLVRKMRKVMNKGPHSFYKQYAKWLV